MHAWCCMLRGGLILATQATVQALHTIQPVVCLPPTAATATAALWLNDQG